METMVSLNSNQLREAAEIKGQIEELQNRLASLLGGAPASATGVTGKRTLSPAARRKIADGQRKRWEAFHAAQAAATPAPAPAAPAPVAAKA